MAAKKRVHSVYIGSDRPFSQVLGKGHVITLPDDGHPYWIFHQKEYERSKKPKVVFAIFQFFGSRSISLDPSQELARYDRVFAIDTNCKQIAVTTAMEAYRPAYGARSPIRKLFTAEFAPSTPTPEREAWLDFIRLYDAGSHLKHCLIVDSELDSLIKINAHEQPILPAAYLPSNWQLNYASSDVSDDFLAVRMLKSCDKLDAEYLRKRRG